MLKVGNEDDDWGGGMSEQGAYTLSRDIYSFQVILELCIIHNY
jgi:hypothetical protein